ncbi:hypothetical protein [Lysinibacillus telephonicus]|uniref:hypothetical protein n=1 Tax=Lysinibacillus telephonicus TaxID=1714840 RepID=UPI0037D37CAE
MLNAIKRTALACAMYVNYPAITDEQKDALISELEFYAMLLETEKRGNLAELAQSTSKLAYATIAYLKSGTLPNKQVALQAINETAELLIHFDEKEGVR